MKENEDIEKEVPLDEAANKEVPVKEEFKISPTPGKDLLMGIGISAVGYGFIFLLFSLGLPMTYVALTTMLIMCVLAFLIVKFFRTKRTNAAVIMLVLWAPSVLFLLLMGSCALLFMGL